MLVLRTLFTFQLKFRMLHQFASVLCYKSVNISSTMLAYKTRGTFWQVPTRRIRLSFVECVYPDLRGLLHNFRGLQWIFQ